jgi:hypothetical protein
VQRRRTLIVVFIAMLAGHSVALAQVDEVWVARYDGPGRGVDTARAVALDSEGGIYVTGVSWGGSADSTGSTGNAQVCTGRDFATVKYDPNGVGM